MLGQVLSFDKDDAKLKVYTPNSKQLGVSVRDVTHAGAGYWNTFYLSKAQAERLLEQLPLMIKQLD